MLDSEQSEQIQVAHKALVQAILNSNVESVTSLLEQQPGLVELSDYHGNTPLHLACSEEVAVAENGDKEYLEVIRYMAKHHAHVLLLRDRLKRTPLHTAISNDHCKSQVEHLLLQACPEAIAARDCTGSTPLHVAACWGTDASLIQAMIKFDVFSCQACQVLNDNGRTVLHEACYHERCGGNDNLTMYRNLVEKWPIACILLDDYGKSPYDDAVRKLRRNAPHVVDYVGEVTKEVTCALLEALAQYQCQIDNLNSILRHLRYILERIFPPHQRDMVTNCLCSSSMSTTSNCNNPNDTNGNGNGNGNTSNTTNDINMMVLTAALRPLMTLTRLKRLLENDNLQNMLKEQEWLAAAVCDFYRMNRAGRSHYLLNDPGNKTTGVKVLLSVRDSETALFGHLRENPSLMEGC